MSQTSDSQLSEGGLNKIVDDVQPQSTERSTKWGVKKLEAWLAKWAIMCDFHSVTAEELNTVLRRFYGELKSVKGDLFTSSALTGIRAAIHRYITGPPFNRSINMVMGHFTARSLHSLKPSVTSQPIQQIEFDFGHFTAYYLLVCVCCPRGFD